MNQSTKKQTRIPFSQRLCESLDLPADTLGRTSFLEAVGNRELLISGCEGLESYTSEQVVLLLVDGHLTVKGKFLTLQGFSCGKLSVNGHISEILYGDASKEEEENL